LPPNKNEETERQGGEDTRKIVNLGGWSVDCKQQSSDDLEHPPFTYPRGPEQMQTLIDRADADKLKKAAKATTGLEVGRGLTGISSGKILA